MTHFVWSDTHFSHRRMHAEFKRKDTGEPLRPFATLEEMNETMVENHNKIVGHNDTVYHCGDFSFGGKQNIALFARRAELKQCNMFEEWHAVPYSDPH